MKKASLSATLDTQQLWLYILAQLQAQLPQATFNTWVNHTRLASYENGVLTIAAPNTYTQEWLEHRLRLVIYNLAQTQTKSVREVKFVVAPPSRNGHSAVQTLVPATSRSARTVAPPTPPTEADTAANNGPSFAVRLVELDPTQHGWVQTSNYAIYFWQPLIGTVPFTVWQFIKSFAYLDSYAPNLWWPSIQRIADTCANGNRHKILGRNVRAGHSAQIGVLTHLENQCILKTNKLGQGDHTQYLFEVIGSLPLLTPAQAQRLTTRLQLTHKEFLQKCKVDYDEWSKIMQPSLLSTKQFS